MKVISIIICIVLLLIPLLTSAACGGKGADSMEEEAQLDLICALVVLGMIAGHDAGTHLSDIDFDAVSAVFDIRDAVTGGGMRGSGPQHPH